MVRSLDRERRVSTNHAMIEQIIVEPSLDLPLSQDDLLDVPCDKDYLYDDIYVIPMKLLKNDHAICVLESNTCATNNLYDKEHQANHLVTKVKQAKFPLIFALS